MTQDVSARQEKLIAALLTEVSIGKAASKAGVNVSTAHRWLKEPGFTTAYRDARRQAMEHVGFLLQRAATTAVATLMRNLTCGLPAVEVSASRAILEMGIRVSENEDIEARLSELEAQSTQRHHHHD